MDGPRIFLWMIRTTTFPIAFLVRTVFFLLLLFAGNCFLVYGAALSDTVLGVLNQHGNLGNNIEKIRWLLETCSDENPILRFFSMPEMLPEDTRLRKYMSLRRQGGWDEEEGTGKTSIFAALQQTSASNKKMSPVIYSSSASSQQQDGTTTKDGGKEENSKHNDIEFPEEMSIIVDIVTFLQASSHLHIDVGEQLLDLLASDAYTCITNGCMEGRFKAARKVLSLSHEYVTRAAEFIALSNTSNNIRRREDDQRNSDDDPNHDRLLKNEESPADENRVKQEGEKKRVGDNSNIEGRNQLKKYNRKHSDVVKWLQRKRILLLKKTLKGSQKKEVTASGETKDLAGEEEEEAATFFLTATLSSQQVGDVAQNMVTRAFTPVSSREMMFSKVIGQVTEHLENLETLVRQNSDFHSYLLEISITIFWTIF